MKNLRKIHQIIIIILLLKILTACLAPPKQQAQLDKSHFANTVTIIDDFSKMVATFSTIRGFQEKYGVYQVVWNDNFLRGFIDKSTGIKTFQIYTVIYYAGSGGELSWQEYNQVDYQTPKGDMKQPVKVIKRDEDCSSLPLYGQCLYSEHLTFEITETKFRRLAKTYKPLSQQRWQYILTAKTGQKQQERILLAELVGLITRMDEYQKTTPYQTKTEKTHKEEKKYTKPTHTPEPAIEPPPASILLPILKKNHTTDKR
jgi:hypothetical protein